MTRKEEGGREWAERTSAQPMTLNYILSLSFCSKHLTELESKEKVARGVFILNISILPSARINYMRLKGVNGILCAKNKKVVMLSTQSWWMLTLLILCHCH